MCSTGIKAKALSSSLSLGVNGVVFCAELNLANGLRHEQITRLICLASAPMKRFTLGLPPFKRQLTGA
jgi:hypothetical protein